MTAATPAPYGYREAIAYLPEGGTLSFQLVPWDKYEKLLDDLGARYKARISYDHGKLEINMPLPIHDYLEICLSRLFFTVADEMEIDLNGLGSTTFNYKDWQEGLDS